MERALFKQKLSKDIEIARVGECSSQRKINAEGGMQRLVSALHFKSSHWRLR